MIFIVDELKGLKEKAGLEGFLSKALGWADTHVFDSQLLEENLELGDISFRLGTGVWDPL